MQFATLEDLAHIGAVPVGVSENSDLGIRATGLLEKASAQAAIYLGITDTDDYTEAQTSALAAIVAEAAASRLQFQAAPTIDGYVEPTPGFVSSLLNRQHYRALDLLFGRGGFGSASIELTRDETSSFMRPYTTADTFGYEP